MKTVYIHSIDCYDEDCNDDCGGWSPTPTPAEVKKIATAPADSRPIGGWAYTAQQLRELFEIPEDVPMR